ncbi:LysR family transcriptional regulator [Achromobacter spanius]|uniref:LysR family transcriptional regulator n=1 Tax=Achromobacter spanius TaxID=217203 RepID=A0A2S0IDE4_9BURK|nr:LysR family transcriptional regulator [Achromobacter spanius]AVJ30055.1 LysR family transcriptional regulator [Achromobacter spanius]
MSAPDLNLLITLDALLSEGSVAGAARRLRLSPSAMSRALARLRDTTGDPLLVRAGRGLVPTPRALALREQVGGLVRDAQAVLRPAEGLDPAALSRTFTLRITDGFVENFGARLLTVIEDQAPGVRLRFMQKLDKDSAPLREGAVDLETGVVGQSASPELRTRALFQDRYIGVMRAAHPLARGNVTLTRYLAARHVLVSRRGRDSGPMDDALAQSGRARHIATVAGGFSTALALVRETDLIATVPERHTSTLREGMRSFALPFAMAPFTVSMLWHPRMDGDAAHRWLRGIVLQACGADAPR